MDRVPRLVHGRNANLAIRLKNIQRAVLSERDSYCSLPHESRVKIENYLD